MLDKVMGFICMLIGVAALSLEINKLRRCSVRATATVVDVRRARDARGFMSYTPIFEFTVDGQTIRSQSNVPASLRKNQFEVGEIREVLYEPGYPENFRLRGNFTLLAIGLFFLLAGVYMYMR